MSGSILSRRAFLQNSTGGALALGAAGAVASLAPALPTKARAAPPRPHPNAGLIFKSVKWGMVTGKLSVMDKFKVQKELGFDGRCLNIGELPSG